MKERKVSEKFGSFSAGKQKAFAEPEVLFESLAEEDGIMLSDGFNGQHEYDTSADWLD